MNALSWGRGAKYIEFVFESSIISIPLLTVQLSRSNSEDCSLTNSWHSQQHTRSDDDESLALQRHTAQFPLGTPSLR